MSSLFSRSADSSPAHISDNLVIVAAHYAAGAFSRIGPLLAVPVFILLLGIVVLWFGQPVRPRHLRLSLLGLHMALLAGCLASGLAFGPFDKSDNTRAIVIGMLAVAAMATQNALVKLSLVNAPSTAVMTTNATQPIIVLVALARSDLRAYARSGGTQTDRSKIRAARHGDIRLHRRLPRGGVFRAQSLNGILAWSR
jgi:uncharacterized membrane protein YoaK (UPF0700 family)